MGRVRPHLGVPFGADGPWLAAILDTLCDIYDLLDARVSRCGQDDAEQQVAAPGRPVPVSEPAPAFGPPLPPAEVDGGQTPAVEPARVCEPALPPTPASEPDPESDPEPEPLPPALPRTCRGSSADAWRRWAADAHVGVPDGASRDDIIVACQQAGVL